MSKSGPVKKENFREANVLLPQILGSNQYVIILKKLICTKHVELKNISGSKLSGHLVNVHDISFIILYFNLNTK